MLLDPTLGQQLALQAQPIVEHSSPSPLAIIPAISPLQTITQIGPSSSSAQLSFTPGAQFNQATTHDIFLAHLRANPPKPGTNSTIVQPKSRKLSKPKLIRRSLQPNFDLVDAPLLSRKRGRPVGNKNREPGSKELSDGMDKENVEPSQKRLCCG